MFKGMSYHYILHVITMNAVEMWSLCGTCGVSLTDGIRNEELHEWQVLARMSRWEWRRMCSTGLGMLNEWVMKEWHKRFKRQKRYVETIVFGAPFSLTIHGDTCGINNSFPAIDEKALYSFFAYNLIICYFYFKTRK